MNVRDDLAIQITQVASRLVDRELPDSAWWIMGALDRITDQVPQDDIIPSKYFAAYSTGYQVAQPASDFPGFSVEDTLRALLKLARAMAQ